MTTTAKPAYLEPREATSPTAQCLYEPALAIGTVVKVKRFDTASCRSAGGETVEVVGIGTDSFKRPDGSTEEQLYAYGLWDTEEAPHIGDWGQLQEHCDREGIDDPMAYVETDAGKKWLTGGHKVGDRRKFYLGQGQFHSALLGTEWVPCVYETVRVKTQPVLGWAASTRQSAYRKRSGAENGHRGLVREAGKFAPESNIQRRRWTTTLSIEALEVLDRMSSELGMHRNEVVEQLVARADALLSRGREAATGDRGNRAADLDGQPTLEEAVMDVCQRHGEDWPRGLGTALGERYGVSRQAVASRKKSALKRIAEEG